MKNSLTLIAILSALFSAVLSQGASPQMPPLKATAISPSPIPYDALQGVKILMVIAPKNFNDDELGIPKEIFEKYGAKVDVVSTQKGEAVGMKGKTVKVEKSISDVDVDEYSAVVFVGGSGTPEIWDNKDIKELALAFDSKNKIIGAICLAPGILAHAGLLKDKPATVFQSAQKEIEKAGAKYTGEKVTVAERIITANGPDAASDFANAVIRLIVHSKEPSTLPGKKASDKGSDEHPHKSCPHHKGE